MRRRENTFYKELILLFHERDDPYHYDDFFMQA